MKLKTINDKLRKIGIILCVEFTDSDECVAIYFMKRRIYDERVKTCNEIKLEMKDEDTQVQVPELF